MSHKRVGLKCCRSTCDKASPLTAGMRVHQGISAPARRSHTRHHRAREPFEEAPWHLLCMAPVPGGPEPAIATQGLRGGAHCCQLTPRRAQSQRAMRFATASSTHSGCNSASISTSKVFRAFARALRPRTSAILTEANYLRRAPGCVGCHGFCIPNRRPGRRMRTPNSSKTTSTPPPPPPKPLSCATRSRAAPIGTQFPNRCINRWSSRRSIVDQAAGAARRGAPPPAMARLRRTQSASALSHMRAPPAVPVLSPRYRPHHCQGAMRGPPPPPRPRRGAPRGRGAPTRTEPHQRHRRAHT